MQSISCTFPLIFLDSGWLFIIFLHFRHFFHLGGNVFLYLWQTVCEIAHKLCEIAHCFLCCNFSTAFYSMVYTFGTVFVVYIIL